MVMWNISPRHKKHTKTIGGTQKMEFIIQSALEHANNTIENDIEIGHANIKVFGVGGGGSNAASWLYKKG